jgi:hypothetical protein
VLDVWDILGAGGYMVWYGMVWYGMVWYGNRIIFIAKVLKKPYTKTKMQRFSKNHTKKQRCKGSHKTIYKNTQKTKMQRFSNTITKNTFTKDKTNRYIYFIQYIQRFSQNHTIQRFSTTL